MNGASRPKLWEITWKVSSMSWSSRGAIRTLAGGGMVAAGDRRNLDRPRDEELTRLPRDIRSIVLSDQFSSMIGIEKPGVAAHESLVRGHLYLRNF